MRLKNILFSSIMISIIILLIIVFSFFTLYKNYQNTILAEEFARETSATVQKLGMLSLQYRLNHNERVQMQMQKLQASLGILLERHHHQIIDHNLKNIIKEYKLFNQLFARLNHINTSYVTQPFDEESVNTELAIARQLQVLLESMGNQVEAWESKFHRYHYNLIHTLIWLMACLLALMIGLLVLWSTVTYRIITPIRKMCIQLPKLASDMSYRFKLNRSDEFGDLTLSINTLAENLQQTVVSKEKLTKEVDKRKLTEKKLLQTNSLYEEAEKIGHVGSWEYNIETQVFFGSHETKNIYGFDPSKDLFSTETVEKCIPDQLRVHQALIDLIEKGKEYNLEFEIIPYDGSAKKTITSIARLQYDSQGRVEKVTGFIQDVTQQKLLLTQLEKIKLFYQDFFKDAPIPYQALDKDGLIIKVNDKWCELTGYDEITVIGKRFTEFLSPFSIPYFESSYKLFYQQGVIDNTELNIVNKQSGQIIPIRIFGNITYYSDGSIFHTNCLLYDLTKERKQELKLQESFDSVMDTFVNIMEEKDVYTAGHSRRVATYCKQIAINIGYPVLEIDLLHRAGQLHDIGKIVTPESILLKPSQFTDQEYVLMKEHAKSGYSILKQMSDYGEIAKIIRHHHERFDGRGYPDGLSAKNIPLPSRIMTIADAFDAMTTNRVYKPRLTISQAIDELSQCSGTQFDPDLIPKAIEYFTTLTQIDNTQAIPFDRMTQYRFAFFFKDGLTRAYNGVYLKIFLNNNDISEKYQNAILINLHGLHSYNKKYGWTNGDEILIQLVDDVINQFDTDMVFRLHGDKLILLTEKSVDTDTITLPDFSDSLLSISQYQHKILGAEHYSIERLFHFFFH